MDDQGVALYASLDTADIDVARETLEGAGYRFHVTSGREATLAQLRETPATVVLIDIEPGTANAFDLGKSIHTGTSPGHSPAIIFLATERTPEIVRQAIASGGDFLIAKPLKADALLAGIEKAIQHHAGTRTAAPAAPPPNPPKAGAVKTGGSVPGRNVLHVDDELLMRKLVRSVLENSGYKVASADGGEEALSFLRKHKPNVILLDVCLGEDDGFSLCRKIRAEFPELEAPVAFLTASRTVEDVQKCREVQGDYFILKPFTAETLSSGINKAFIMWRKSAAAKPAS